MVVLLQSPTLLRPVACLPLVARRETPRGRTPVPWREVGKRSTITAMRVFALLALLALRPVLPALASGGGCAAECAAVFSDALEQGCGSCATQAVDARFECRMRVRNSIDCVRQCGPGFPGRCTLTLECLDSCRLARASRLDQCDGRFRHRVRKGCSGGRLCWAAARGARRQCLRECRQRRTGSATPAAPPSPRPAARI